MKDSSQGPHHPTVYSFNTDEIIFALTATREQPMCGYILLRTEHPKHRGNAPKPRSDIPVDNLDIFIYVNSKFVYVKKHIRNQMTTLYYNVMQQRCELESEVLRNTLSFATILLDEFAYRLMKGPGYMADSWRSHPRCKMHTNRHDCPENWQLLPRTACANEKYFSFSHTEITNTHQGRNATGMFTRISHALSN